MNRDVFLSILSMDTYNRGDSGLHLTGAIGNATLQGLPGVNENTGFYAQAYSWDGSTVISYRGTDFGDGLGDPDLTTDVLAGWVNGAGAITGQMLDAVTFYNDVTGGTLSSGEEEDVILLGHSLGGGLAGFIGHVTGTQAYMVSNA